MKKIIISIVCILSMLFCVSVNNVYARDIFEENPKDSINAFSFSKDIVKTKNRFNIVRGISDVEELKNNRSFRYALEEMPKDGWTKLNYYYDVQYERLDCNASFVCELSFKVNSSGVNELTGMTVNLKCDNIGKNYLVYVVRVVNGTPSISYDSEIDLTGFFEEYNKDFEIPFVYFQGTDKMNRLEYKECYQNFDLSFLYAMYFNPIVDGKGYIDVISDFDNPITIEEIQSKIKVSDETSNARLYLKFTDYMDDDYSIGDYEAYFLAVDDYGNITRLALYIEIKDIRGPKIIYDSIETSYLEELDKETLKSYFEISDSNGVKDIKYDFSNYLNDPKVVGEHIVTVSATDNYGNESKKNVVIKVNDNIKPVIKVKPGIISTANNTLSYDEIKNYIEVFDEVDGEITNYELNDLDNYKTKELGYSKYRFEVVARDNAGNEETMEFAVVYNDGDYPQIEIDDLIFELPNGLVVFKKDIEQLLYELGYIDLKDSIDIESKNANSSNTGYDLVVKMNDKRYSVELVNNEDSFNVVKFEEIKAEEMNYTTFIISGIIGVALLVSIVMGVKVYKKRH